MSLFVVNRSSFAVLSVCFALFANMIFIPVSHADDWGDILKPLMKDVILPGAKLGVKKWVERKKGKSESNEVIEVPPEVQTVEPTGGEYISLPMPAEETATITVQPAGADVTVPTPEAPFSSTVPEPQPEVIIVEPGAPPPPEPTPAS